jgi:hypothetical protein
MVVAGSSAGRLPVVPFTWNELTGVTRWAAADARGGVEVLLVHKAHWPPGVAESPNVSWQ